MTAVDIVGKLFTAKGVTRERIEKAKGAALRATLSWADVLAAMTKKQRAQVEKA